MLPNKHDASYLWDMLQAANRVVKFTNKITYSKYESNQMMQSAVERQFEIIGEAARHISEEFKEAHPEIAWQQIIGLRNLLIHKYGEVKTERIWIIIHNNIGELISFLKIFVPDSQE